MQLNFSHQMKMSQQMKLAPRMIQSMEILQLPTMELDERIGGEVGTPEFGMMVVTPERGHVEKVGANGLFHCVIMQQAPPRRHP